MGYGANDCCCGCRLCFNAMCGATAVPGADVTVSQSGTTVATCTTDGTGNCCVDIPASGTYDYSVAAMGYTTVTGSRAMTCPETATVDVNFCCGQICFRVAGCGRVAAGATVTVTLGGTTVGTCTTDATGQCCVPITSAATYSYSIAKTGYTTATGTVVATCTTNVKSVTLAVAAGYTCTPPAVYCCNVTGTPPYLTDVCGNGTKYPTLHWTLAGSSGTTNWPYHISLPIGSDTTGNCNCPTGGNDYVIDQILCLSGRTWKIFIARLDALYTACNLAAGCNFGPLTATNTADCSHCQVSLTFNIPACTFTAGGVTCSFPFTTLTLTT